MFSLGRLQVNIVRGKDGFGFTICSDCPVKVQAVDSGENQLRDTSKCVNIEQSIYTQLQSMYNKTVSIHKTGNIHKTTVYVNQIVSTEANHNLYRPKYSHVHQTTMYTEI